MNRLSPLLVLAVLAAPTVARADDEVVDILESLSSAASPGGAAITSAEAAAFAREVPARLSGDEAILGIVIANRLRFEAPIADDDYAVLQRALRRRVEGLAVSLLQAPGTTFARRSADLPLVARVDAGVALDRVDVVFSWDGWATTRAVSLRANGRVWTGELGVAPATGRLAYAVHVFGPDGRDFWLNYGLERGVLGGQGFLDYSLDLAATDGRAVAPSQPALVKLIRTFTHPASAGGASITDPEVSLVVEMATWEGGPGIQDDDVLLPAIAEVDRLVDEGADFAVDDAILRGFLDRQRLRYAAMPAAFFERASGDLRIRIPRGVYAAEVVYSTDGWNLPKRSTCERSGAGVLCSLGHVPRGALLAYAVKLIAPDGTSSWQHAERGLGRPSNFFHKVP